MTKKNQGQYMGIAMGLGSGVGIAIGVVLDNVTLGMSIGLVLGAGVGASLGQNKKTAENKASRLSKKAQKIVFLIAGVATLVLAALFLSYFFEDSLRCLDYQH